MYDAYKSALRRFGKRAASLDGGEFIDFCEHETINDAYQALGLYESPNACLDMM